MYPTDEEFYRTTIDYPCDGDRAGACRDALISIWSIIATFEMHAVEGDLRPVHELLAFDETEDDPLSGPLFRGVQYPAGYDGSLKYGDYWGEELEMATAGSTSRHRRKTARRSKQADSICHPLK